MGMSSMSKSFYLERFKIGCRQREVVVVISVYDYVDFFGCKGAENPRD